MAEQTDTQVEEQVPKSEKPVKPKKDKKSKKVQRDENGKKIFTADSGLGFMRLIQMYNIFSILFVMFMLIFVTHAMLNEMGTTIVVCQVVDLFVAVLIVWLLAKRKMHTRFIMPVLYAIKAIVETIAWSVQLGFSVSAVVQGAALPILISIYFLTSRRAKAVLVQPFDVKFLSRETAAERKMWNPKSLDFWMRVLIYFFAFSVLGHWMEMGVQILVVNGLFPGTVAGSDSLTWRDSWNPFFIYGIAVAICALALFPLYVKFKELLPKVWMGYVASFLLNWAFVVVAEVILGVLFNADYSAWDYRNQFLNWNGQVCFLYSLAFAVMASVITWIVYPFLEFLFSFVSKDAMRVIFVISLVFFIFLYCTYNVDLTNLYSQYGFNALGKKTS